MLGGCKSRLWGWFDFKWLWELKMLSMAGMNIDLSNEDWGSCISLGPLWFKTQKCLLLLLYLVQCLICSSKMHFKKSDLQTWSPLKTSGIWSRGQWMVTSHQINWAACTRNGIQSPKNTRKTGGEHDTMHETCDWKSGLFH